MVFGLPGLKIKENIDLKNIFMESFYKKTNKKFISSLKEKFS